jgi:hypothetical protein
MEVKQALGVAPGAVLVRSSSFPIEEWLFHFLHLSSLNRVQPALFFSDATGFYYMLHVKFAVRFKHTACQLHIAVDSFLLDLNKVYYI